MRTRPSKTHRERKVSLTLTVGECEVIRSSIIFAINGESYSKAVRFWLTKGLEETMRRRAQGET